MSLIGLYSKIPFSNQPPPFPQSAILRASPHYPTIYPYAIIVRLLQSFNQFLFSIDWLPRPVYRPILACMLLRHSISAAVAWMLSTPTPRLP